MKKNRKLLVCCVLVILMLPIKNGFGQDADNLKISETIGPENGALIIIGGNVNEEIWNKFKELMGGPDKNLVVIPTAHSDADYDQNYLDKQKQNFIKKGFSNVTVLHTRDRAEANSEEFTSKLDTASGVWLSGGRQWRHADSYLNTKTQDALNKVLQRGGVIAGSSAGATIQGSYLARGDSNANTIMMGDHEEGFGFVKNVAIDQHLLARNRQFDMFEILDNEPNLLGIGIDEKNTAIVVKRNKFSVIGESYVVIYDGTRWSKERDTIYRLPKGSREFYTLKSGDEYNLKARAVISYRNREFIRLTESELENYCGEYQLTETQVKSEVFIKNGSLFSKVNDQISLLLPESKTRFYVSKSDLYLDFMFDPNGTILKAIVPAQNQTWEKLK